MCLKWDGENSAVLNVRGCVGVGVHNAKRQDFISLKNGHSIILCPIATSNTMFSNLQGMCDYVYLIGQHCTLPDDTA